MTTSSRHAVLAAFALLVCGCSGPGGSAGVSLPAPTPTPTPAPTATPARGPVAVSPGSLTFANTGNNCGPTGTTPCAQTFSASETGYAGTFTASSGNTSVATVIAGPGANVFTVTPVGAGNTTVTVTDATMQNATVMITVTTTPIAVR